MDQLSNESIFRGRFRILKKVGEGGSSRVYMAVDLKDNMPVIIKMMRKDIFDIKDLSLVVAGETRMISKLDHPAVPKVLKVYDDCFVMEYIPGNSLEKHLKNKGRFDEAKAVRISLELLEILRYLHDRKPPVIYRDLKPANIIIKPDGHVSLIDFGAARLYSNNGEDDTTNLGTMGFAAPEQFGCLGQTDPRTDIYCFGKTLFLMVSGKCSPELMSIIEKCIKPDRDDRFNSCSEIIKALKNYPRKKIVRRILQNTRIAAVALLISAAVTFGFAHYDGFVSYAAVDAQSRMPAVKERLGYAGIRIKEKLEEKGLWPYEIDFGGEEIR